MNSSTTPRTNPKTLVNGVFAKLSHLLRTEGMTENLPQQEEDLERMNLGIFRLVVMGEIKKGKSSFINALLKTPGLLPTDVGVATSTVYKLIYGPKLRIKIFLQEDTETGIRPEPLVVGASQLVEYGTEKGNPHNEKRVDFIGLEIPSPLLKEGLVIIDTPGVGGLYKAHRDTTWRYAPNADAIFFCLDSVEALLSADEIKFLKEITEKVTKRVFFVQTKTDAADTETVKAWESRNKELLRERVGIPEKSLLYFPISSKLKHKADETKSGKRLARSGFTQLLDFLHHNLMPRKEEELARDAAKPLLGDASRLHNALQERDRIFRQQTEQESNAIKAEFMSAQKVFRDWSNKTFPQAIKDFQNGFENLRRKCRNKLQDELDPKGTIVAEAIGNLSNLPPQEFVSKAPEIGQRAIAIAADRTTTLTKNFLTEVGELGKNVLLRLDFEKNLSLPSTKSQSDLSSINTAVYIENLASGMDRARGTFSGVSMGGVSGYAVGALAALFFPPSVMFSPILVPIFGILVGGYMGHKDAVNKERRNLVIELKRQLCDSLAIASRKALNGFEEQSEGIRHKFLNNLELAQSGREKELSARIDELSESRKLGEEERSKKAKKIQDDIRDIEGILHKLQSLWS